MGRYDKQESYNHHCKRIMGIGYEISWVYDTYSSGSCLRFPQYRHKFVNEAGARIFCKKWNIEFPESETKNEQI